MIYRVLLRLLAVSLFGGGPVLHAGFGLTGELPAALAGRQVTVHRESLEQRSSEQLGSAPVIDGRFRLQVGAVG